MTESMMVEAIKAVGSGVAQLDPASGVQPVPETANPASVARFQAAMGTDPIPFASEMSVSWRSAQVNHQGLLHRIRALSEMHNGAGNVAAMELMELQYDVMNLAFQQEIVTKVADKASNAIQTLVKNQ